MSEQLDACLRRAGCARYTGCDALADAAETWREIRSDNLAHGEPQDQPFCNWVFTEGVAVFVFYDDEAEFFIIEADEPEFRETFEPLAMVEVDQARMLLSLKYGRCSPDLAIRRSLLLPYRLDFKQQ